MQVPALSLCAKGMQRIVALVSSLILASQSALPHQKAEANPALHRGLEFVVVLGLFGMRVAEIAGAVRAALPEFQLSVLRHQPRANPPAGRRTSLPCRACRAAPGPRCPWPRPSARSRCASGTPRISQSLNLKPGLVPSRSSMRTRIPAVTRPRAACAPRRTPGPSPRRSCRSARSPPAWARSAAAESIPDRRHAP